MKATFTVTVEVPSEESSCLESVAQEIEIDLLSAGYNVDNVSPWARPSQGDVADSNLLGGTL